MKWKAIGSVYNDSHSSSPVIVGDFNLIRQHYSSDHGVADEPIIDVGESWVVQPDFELKAPLVLVGDDVRLVTAPEYYGAELGKLLSKEQVQTVASADLGEVESRAVISVPSGVLAIALFYVDADDDIANWPDEAGSTTKSWDPTLTTVSVEPGAYEVCTYAPTDAGLEVPVFEEEPDGEKHAFTRVVVRRVKDEVLRRFSEKRKKAKDKAARLATEAAKEAETARRAHDVAIEQAVASLSAQPSEVLALVVVDHGESGREGDIVTYNAAADAAVHAGAANQLPPLAPLTALRRLEVRAPLEGGIDDAIGALPLREVDLRGFSNLAALPKAMATLGELEVVRLPASVTEIAGGLPYPKLRILELSLGALTAAGDLSQLGALEELHVVRGADSSLWKRAWDASLEGTSLPDLGALRSLRVLSGQFLGLEEMPDVSALEKLRVVDLVGGRIKTAIDRLGDRARFETLELAGHHLGQGEKETLGLVQTSAARSGAKAPTREFAQPDWDAIASMVVVGGERRLLVAGERGGFRVCAWDLASNELAWQVSLGEGRDIDAYTHVALADEGGLHASTSSYEGMFYFLSPDGEILRGVAAGTPEGNFVGFHSFVVCGEVVIANGFGPLGEALTDVLSYPDIELTSGLLGHVGRKSPKWPQVSVEMRQFNDLNICNVPSFQFAYHFSKLGSAPHVFSPDAQHIVVQRSDGMLVAIGVMTAQPEFEMPWTRSEEPREVAGWPAFDDTNTLLALVIDERGSIDIIDWSTRERVGALPAHDRPAGLLDPMLGALQLKNRRLGDVLPIAWSGRELVVGARSETSALKPGQAVVSIYAF